MNEVHIFGVQELFREIDSQTKNRRGDRLGQSLMDSRNQNFRINLNYFSSCMMNLWVFWNALCDILKSFWGKFEGFIRYFDSFCVLAWFESSFDYHFLFIIIHNHSQCSPSHKTIAQKHKRRSTIKCYVLCG